MEPHPHRHHYRLIIVVLFVCFALIGIGLIVSYQRMGVLQRPMAVSDQAPMPTRAVSPTIQPSEAPMVSFELVEDPANTRSLSDPLMMTIIANSYGNPILGFDVILGRVADTYDVISVKSLLPEFTVLKFIKDDRVTMTGIMKLAETEPIVFDNTPLISVVLQPKTQGEIELAIQQEVGSETSKMISPDEQGNPIRLSIDKPPVLRVDIN